MKGKEEAVRVDGEESPVCQTKELWLCLRDWGTLSMMWYD